MLYSIWNQCNQNQNKTKKQKKKVKNVVNRGVSQRLKDRQKEAADERTHLKLQAEHRTAWKLQESFEAPKLTISGIPPSN